MTFRSNRRSVWVLLGLAVSMSCLVFLLWTYMRGPGTSGSSKFVDGGVEHFDRKALSGLDSHSGLDDHSVGSNAEALGSEGEREQVDSGVRELQDGSAELSIEDMQVIAEREQISIDLVRELLSTGRTPEDFWSCQKEIRQILARTADSRARLLIESSRMLPGPYLKRLEGSSLWDSLDQSQRADVRDLVDGFVNELTSHWLATIREFPQQSQGGMLAPPCEVAVANVEAQSRRYERMDEFLPGHVQRYEALFASRFGPATTFDLNSYLDVPID